MADQDSFIHLARPLPSGPVPPTYQASTAPLNVVIHAQALFSIIDHQLRRNTDQDRVIGTLLGIRSEDGSEVEIRNAFAVGHNESQEQVEVDMDYHKTMYALHLKANPREILVGWYATSPELNTFSALIQNFYASPTDGTFPHPAVHLTLSTVPGQPISIRTYISAPVGTTPDRAADSCLFLPVPHELRYSDAEKSGLEQISTSVSTNPTTTTTPTPPHPLPPTIQTLESTLHHLLHLLTTLTTYVTTQITTLSAEETNDTSHIPPETLALARHPTTTSIGKYLLNTLSLAPKVNAEEIEKMFNTHIQDVLMVNYLANTIRTQIDLGNRLATMTVRDAGTTKSGTGAGAGGAAGEDASTGATASSASVAVSTGTLTGETVVGGPSTGGRKGRA